MCRARTGRARRDPSIERNALHCLGISFSNESRQLATLGAHSALLLGNEKSACRALFSASGGAYRALNHVLKALLIIVHQDTRVCCPTTLPSPVDDGHATCVLSTKLH